MSAYPSMVRTAFLNIDCTAFEANKRIFENISYLCCGVFIDTGKCVRQNLDFSELIVFFENASETYRNKH